MPEVGGRGLRRFLTLEARLRLRQGGLPLLLLAMVVVTALYLPARDAAYLTLSVNGQRGAYSWAWVGLVTGVLGALAFSLAGLFLVGRAPQRDAANGSWALLATSPASRVALLGARTLADTLLLWALWGVVLLGSVAVVLARGEATGAPDLGALLLPGVLITFPVLALVAALGTLLDAVIPRARLGRGVAGVLLWTALVGVTLGTPAPVPDLLGVREPLRQATLALTGRVAAPFVLAESGVNVGVQARTAPLTPQAWTGLTWTPADVAGRTLPVALAVALVLVAALFDLRRGAPRRSPSPRTARPIRPWPMPAGSGLRLALLDVRAALLGAPRWLPLAALALGVAGVGAAANPGGPLLPLLLIVGVPVAARVVFQERASGTEALLGTTVRGATLPLRRGAAAFAVLVLPASGALLALLPAHPDLSGALVITALLTVALLLTLRDLRVTDAASESLLFLAWYLGPFNHLGVLDTLNPAHALPTLALSAALLALHAARHWPRRLPHALEVPA
ncbi:hypothetical protein [Deinococcus radiotolerans]|uniref:ABC transporter permease n=1 Tax=Deinococcus radiotolerans TaxID=1309407 RepID=A0ABQ2FN84_9DEIO|nr:hypothetical protein [Deinococcus radiotolerans]GGL10567.1 hypothetical protein GCM10010844_31560 [Deinococcus radiotolerans]